jgi:hypothetical protein
MWEFFQDAQGLWRWRCTRDGGQRVFNSERSYATREQAVAAARLRGYADGAAELDSGDTFVNLRILREID